MFGHYVHMWSWLVEGVSFLFLACSFGRGYIHFFFISVQPAQDRRRMDRCKSLRRFSHITADPTVSYLQLILHG